MYGRIQWIGAEKMTVTKHCMLLEESCNPVSVTFELKQVPQSSYQAARAGDWVFVEGFVSHEDGRHRVMATSVMLVEETQAP
jgi:hypothetical protein